MDRMIEDEPALAGYDDVRTNLGHLKKLTMQYRMDTEKVCYSGLGTCNTASICFIFQKEKRLTKDPQAGEET